MRRFDNVYHFVFGLKPQTEPFHLAYYLCLASCLQVNRPERIYFHYKHEPYGYWWDRIKPSLVLNQVDTGSFLEAYVYRDKAVAQYRYAHLSDIVRLEMLQQHGGIYADIDTLFVNPVPASFFDEHCILGRERVDTNTAAGSAAGGSLCNAWIAAEKGAEFIRLWLENMEAGFDGSWSAHSTFLPYSLSRNYPALLHVEPEHAFYKFDWTPEGIRNIFRRNRTADAADIYSIHLWSHLWWDRRRKDFTRFCNEDLTVNYLQFSNATYASLARRFLPGDLEFSKSGYRKERLKQYLRF